MTCSDTLCGAAALQPLNTAQLARALPRCAGLDAYVQQIQAERFFRRTLTASISNAADLISELVTNETSRNEDPSLLERLRREAAHRVMAAN